MTMSGCKLNWPLGYPPPDVPKCGFDNEDPACNQGDCPLPSWPPFWRHCMLPVQGVEEVLLSGTEGFPQRLRLPFLSLHPLSEFID